MDDTTSVDVILAAGPTVVALAALASETRRRPLRGVGEIDARASVNLAFARHGLLAHDGLARYRLLANDGRAPARPDDELDHQPDDADDGENDTDRLDRDSRERGVDCEPEDESDCSENERGACVDHELPPCSVSYNTFVPRKVVLQSFRSTNVQGESLGTLIERALKRAVAHQIAMPSDYADARGAIKATREAEDEFQTARNAFIGFAVRTVGAKLPNA